MANGIRGFLRPERREERRTKRELKQLQKLREKREKLETRAERSSLITREKERISAAKRKLPKSRLSGGISALGGALDSFSMEQPKRRTIKGRKTRKLTRKKDSFSDFF